MNSNYYSGNWISALLSVIIIISVLGILYFYGYFYQPKAGAGQPIPFSHRWHAGVKNISCLMCHEGVLRTAHAGIPPSETCMLCHERVIVHYPHIERMNEMHSEREPIKWIKVSYLPDFVNFDHSVHTANKIDCGRCHGNVSGMDRIIEAQQFKMGFCTDCHREFGATVDCYACHY